MRISGHRPAAVLFDRDGTLIVNVPYNADPDRVTPMPGARRALDRLRRAGLRIGVVSNQSGVAKGIIGHSDLAAVNARVERFLGPFDVWAVCPHDDADGCACRKPAPGLILRAAAILGVTAKECAVIGDIGSDMGAARAAGARGILVPSPDTLWEEVAAADEVADDLMTAVDHLLY
jgi:HAD superfamily hydrolase (TIGR01662 family)